MKKSALVEAVSKKLGVTKKEAEAAYDAVVDALTEELLQGNDIVGKNAQENFNRIIGHN